MKGVVMIEDGQAVHVIPRAEIRHAEVVALGSDNWALKYQLADTIVIRSVEWKGEGRPESLKTKVSIGEYNKMAAEFVLTVLTRGHRDVHLERRQLDNVFLVRSGLIENDAQVVLVRKFIAEMALTARQTAIGPLDDTRRLMLSEIQTAAQDLILPDWFPLKDAEPFHVKDETP